MTEQLTQEIKNQFEVLASRLSPENLSCDGELSRSETNRRYSQCKREWRTLERRIGRTVNEDEVWEWERSK